ncbi:MAG: hypothetical protein QOK15_2426 [Nocardioidaceae bacterium]|nr:hypothetical protein [Nocardioidaceae bacterium]
MREQEFLELLPATVVEVGCGDDLHRLRWWAGELSSLDHDDPEGERTLAALGGTSNGCVTALDAWQRQRTSLRVLTLASRGAADRLQVEPDDDGGLPSRVRRGGVSSRRRMPAAYRSTTSMTSGWAPFGVSPPRGGSGAAVDQADDVDALFAVGPALADRLAATVATHWAERVEAGATADSDQPALQAVLTGRVWLAVQAWVGLPPEAVDVRMTAPTEVPAATYDHGRLTIAVPFRWLSRVWAPGLAVITGRLTLDAQREGDAVTLSALEPDGTPARTTITV